MKDGTKNIIAASIIAFGLIFSTIIYVYSTRYEIIRIPEGGIVKIDKWNGTGVNITKAD